MQKATVRPEVSGEAGGDKLSKLPDEILLNILERVGTLDALRTCFLSKRMLKIPPMLSQFDIDIGSLVRYFKLRANTVSHIVRCNIVVASVTEKILAARNVEIPIRKLSVTFCLRRHVCLSISKAVARAMATQKVEDAEFVVLTKKTCLKCTQDDLLCFAKQFNSWFSDCPAVFAGLTRLWLRNLRFGELDIPNILSTCKRLESLRLSYCDAGVCSVLQVEHAQLVELHIDYGEFEAVQLTCLPKLQCVHYNCWSYQGPLIFGSVPQLSKLSLENIGISSTSNLQLSQFLANVPWISNLHLDFRSEKVLTLPIYVSFLLCDAYNNTNLSESFLAIEGVICLRSVHNYLFAFSVPDLGSTRMSQTACACAWQATDRESG